MMTMMMMMMTDGVIDSRAGIVGGRDSISKENVKRESCEGGRGRSRQHGVESDEIVGRERREKHATVCYR